MPCLRRAQAFGAFLQHDLRAVAGDLQRIEGNGHEMAADAEKAADLQNGVKRLVLGDDEVVNVADVLTGSVLHFRASELGGPPTLGNLLTEMALMMVSFAPGQVR